ncbi:stearoyl-CoA desaturase 5-like isoform X1 [Dermacentor variabilis]|uniref:stearoyl-CoA desaturase 5-like isoform X1 n=1 Tax=Dermacentor variabilis TaxID=34621 RepID=UPI003F5B62A3
MYVHLCQGHHDSRCSLEFTAGRPPSYVLKGTGCGLVVQKKRTMSTVTETVTEELPAPKPYKREIVWRNVLLMGSLHLISLYGFYLIFFTVQWKTVLAAYILYTLSGIGITAGSHRMWSHKSYKAKLPYRIMMMVFQTMAFQNDIYEWARDHRMHHKYSETTADPHDATRGFFFSHVGWLLVRKHPDVRAKGKTIDMSDLLADPVVRFQRKHYLSMMVVICFVLPAVVPWWLWGESLWNAFLVCSLTRYCFTLNMTWLVNSAAHMWGNRPYDKHINPRQNLVTIVGAHGEGFHNYHHTFPYDYRASELGCSINTTTWFIDFFAWLGQVYDRKEVPTNVVERRMERTGDGSRGLTAGTRSI